MKAVEVRKSFFDFFASKQHKIVPSAPMVVKDDPTLMFTNAGMNQFKDIFLGNAPAVSPRVADSQKCLRVSGKHNDLEEVGHDTYHHTMFEMLGNWSFDDYFKREAIDWAWEYLTDVLKIDSNLLYVTVFEGSNDDGVQHDSEAYECWLRHLPQNRIVNGSKKDNFWEMGDTGPCGPCSEIHVDLRSADERSAIAGEKLVNRDHPEVIEIWNLVFIQFNRKADGSLVELPKRHVDTGMGFERLCRVMQKKTSNYDTDVFQPIIHKIAEVTGVQYGMGHDSDVAMRVIADHVRTICFAITDGQLPSNNKAGYVIRRILRRAVRYAYTFLNVRQPFMAALFPALVNTMGDAYPELTQNQELIKKVVSEEEESFLRTLATGISMLDKIIDETARNGYKVIEGRIAFELYDTFGFPLDLTELILKEHGLVVNRREFEKEMEAQKQRARKDSSVETEDWVQLYPDDREEFIGYDYLETTLKLVRYRRVKMKNRALYHLVFNITPFYAESGGQVGDTGYIEANGIRTEIFDTKRENNLIIHLSETLPANPAADFRAVVDAERRQMIANNHTATHLLHKALRTVLGSHVEQKGSLVHPDYLRFDFAHYEKVSDDNLRKVEQLVNKDVRKNIALNEHREVPLQKAREMGAIALFGEKYGDVVRTITFGNSVELCGGTHIRATGEIGIFRILSESSIASGIRRIEAVTAGKAEEFLYEQTDMMREMGQMFKNNLHIRKNVECLIRENTELAKRLAGLAQTMMNIEVRNILDKAENVNGILLVNAIVNPMFGEHLKDIAFKIRAEAGMDAVVALGVEAGEKAQLAVILTESLVEAMRINAVEVIKAVSKEIQGGGGGQPFFATAGGKNSAGLTKAIDMAVRLVKEKLMGE
jgi:alanyl-tRNA synthetase